MDIEENGDRIVRCLGLRSERRVGVQRYKCEESGNSFTLRRRNRPRYTGAFEIEVVRRCIEQRESYRVMAKRIKEETGKRVSTGWLNQVVIKAARNCKSAVEMSKEVRRRSKGYPYIDEMMFSERGDQRWFNVAVDTSGDIVHCRSVKELSMTETAKFLTEVEEEAGYKCRGVVTYPDTSLRLAVKAVFRGKPHQFCLKHEFSVIESRIGYNPLAVRQGWNERTLRRKIRKLRDEKGIRVEKAREGFFSRCEEHKKTPERYRALRLLQDELHSFLFAGSEEEAGERLHRLSGSNKHRMFVREKRSAISFLKTHWKNLMM